MTNFNEKNAAKQHLREEKKQLLLAAKETAAREWDELCKQFEGVYVFRSDLHTDDFVLPLRLRKVTVVGAVKKNETGTYELYIAWSKCHEKDNFCRKAGNLIALRRAANPEKEFVTDGYIKAKPLVLRNFATDRIKENFVPIASLIVDAFEDVYNRQTENAILAKEGFVPLFLCNISNLFHKQLQIEDVDAEEILA